MSFVEPKNRPTANFRVQDSLQSSTQLVLFDLSIYGHHPVYIQHLINYWQQNQPQGKLAIVVLPQFLKVHADVVDLAFGIDTIEFISITVAEASKLKPRSSGLSRNYRNFQEWSMFKRYATNLQANHCLMLYLLILA